MFEGWYFNLEDAPRRTAMGFDTLDNELDVWWGADAESYEFMDVAEFEETGPARYPGRMDQIRAEGDRVAYLLGRGELWWDKAWADWVPNVSWLPREVPTDWEDVAFETR